MQLVSAIEPENEEQVQFAWSLSISDGVDMIFKLEFEKPEYISSSGVDHDQMRIFFVDTDSYIQCQPEGDQIGRRLLQDDSSRYMPEMTVLKVELPPQIPEESADEELSFDTTSILMLAVMTSIAMGVPSEIIYDGILAA